MGRLVRKPRLQDRDAQIAGLEGLLAGHAGVQAAVAETGDNYLERMAKYIPAEVLGFFMLINAILDQAMKSGGPNAAMAGFPVVAIATGALAVALSEGMPLPTAACFANAAGALCCTRLGAQPALPTREAVEMIWR